MAKDPAVLFYTSDFLTGTVLMNHEQVGKYIRLLCIQHQKDTLSEKDMFNICGTYDEDVFNKFTKTDDGYINIRMKEEKEKRSKYCSSRSDNRVKGIKNKEDKKKKKTKAGKSTYDEHMENENTIININKSVNPVVVYSKSLELVSKMDKQLSDTDAIDLVEKFGYTQTMDILRRMNNYKKLLNNTSVYDTAYNWLKRAMDDKKEKSGTTGVNLTGQI
jgi:hypothetical protein